MRDNQISIRRAGPHDGAFLWRMLCYAASMEGGDTEQNIVAAQEDAFLQKYVAGWGKAGDIGVLAENEEGAALGAAWIRPGTDAEAEPGHPSATEPELAIAVHPAHRGQGIGMKLLAALAHEATGNYIAIVLSVRASNPAVRLYERAGFLTVGEIVNRVGGRSLVMRLPLPATHTVSDS